MIVIVGIGLWIITTNNSVSESNQSKLEKADKLHKEAMQLKEEAGAKRTRMKFTGEYTKEESEEVQKLYDEALKKLEEEKKLLGKE